MTVGGQQVDGLLHVWLQRPVGAFEGDEPRQLIGTGQLRVPEQQCDLLKAELGGKLLNRVAAVEQGVGLGLTLETAV